MPLNSPLPVNRRTGAFERRVARALAGADVAGRVIVAVSGGPDSTAALVAAVRALDPGRVVAAHFDHRLRSPAEVERERALVAAVASRLDVPLVSGRASRRPTDSSEAASRESRYRWLARVCREHNVRDAVTGHTQDDQAETVLLRLARGTGAGGLAGMASAAAWPLPGRGARDLRVVRPLLGITRAEVEAYLAALGLGAALDPSNLDLSYARNRLRHRVLPELHAVNQRAGEHLARFAEQQREDEQYLLALAQEWLDAHARTSRDAVEMDRAALRMLHPAIARRAVREAGVGLGLALESAHLRAILDSLDRNHATVDLRVARSECDGMILRLRLRPSPSGAD